MTIITKIISYSAVSIMILILLVACCNFFIINGEVKKASVKLQYTTDSISSIINTSIVKSDSVKQQTDLLSKKNLIQNDLQQLKELKVGVFDSNTLTFLCSFLLVFLGGILFSIESRANRQIKKSEDIMKRFDAECQHTYIFNQINAVHFLANQLQFDFIEHKNIIKNSTNVIVFEMYSRTEDLLSILKKKKYSQITRTALEKDKDIINKVITIISNEQVIENSQNKNKLSPLLNLSINLKNMLEYLDDMNIINN
jgi:hypothetical protein